MKHSTHRPKKHLGQNFLADPAIIHRIRQKLPLTSKAPWLEIGPGLGALSAELAPHVDQLTMVEKDQDVIPGLQKALKHANPTAKHTIIHADVLKLDFDHILTAPTHVVGNLPYQISSPLLFRCIAHANNILDMHFMLQKEVAMRLAAKPKERHYGRLSVMTQYHCDVQLCFHVPPTAFNPPPKVDSSFVQLLPHEVPPYPADDSESFATWVRLAFSQRRKKLGNTLKKHLSPKQREALLPWATQRAEQLDVQAFVTLANRLGKPENQAS